MTKRYAINLNQVQTILQATPQTLRTQLSSLDTAALTWRPGPDEWSINECIGHLIECDLNGFAGRIQTILSEDTPQLAAWDVAGRVTARRDNDRDGLELIAKLDSMRQENTRFIISLTAKQLARAGIHSTVGELTVADLTFEWVHHDLNHIKQMFSNIQDYIWPDLGNAQRFFQSDLNPYL